MHATRRGIACLAAACLVCAALPHAQGKRPLAVDDLYNVRDVRDPQRSPDGQWVAYTVTRAVRDTDKNDTDIWMASWDGRRRVQLTSSADVESRPRWSPDGKFISFTAAREGSAFSQVWLLSRAGGEAIKVTDVTGGVADYAWSPDAKRLMLVVNEPDPKSPPPAEVLKNAGKPGKPVVVDRYVFKSDRGGYLRGERTHLYLCDVAARTSAMLTTGTFDESAPVWSPNSQRIAFIRRHGNGDVDKAPSSDVFVIEARAGAVPARLTTSGVVEDGRLSWSPDGRSIAYELGEELKYYAYVQSKIAIVPAAGGHPTILTASLDRSANNATFSTGAADGANVVFTVVDDRSQYIARVPAAGGRVDRLWEGWGVVTSASTGPDPAIAVLASTATTLPEVHALENGRLRKLTAHNDDWLGQRILGSTEEFTSISRDGTEVHGLIVKPPTFTANRRYPALLRIHGGPNSQDEHSFSFERELFAANGYVVVAVNYRGSTGRGAAFQKAIAADWGNKEVIDLLGAMDHVERRGFIDPDRLGIGGWSYGGILTNYAIASDRRFKAATSGAGSSNQISMYGTDQYVQQYEHEIGPPWKAADLWVKLSYPFFHADRIKTPTLFMGGEKDFNVPLSGSEQMYQALRSLGVETELVIYPDQRHNITVPSYRADRLERYLAWYEKYLRASNTIEVRR
jgi:dipeptidyl aminopeptidase/acylaminoacyl peptidase